MSGLRVVEWKRHGLHRLYVKTEAGEDVGWVDLKSSQFGLEREDLRSEFESALREQGIGYLSDGGRVLVTTDRRVRRPTVTADPMGLHQWDQQPDDCAPEVDPQEPPWTDLARNEPGQGIRSLARAHRSAAPLRTTVARLLKMHNDERAYRVGVDGEEETGEQLARLAAGWCILHSVPVGSHGSDIDHVVIGPGGVFTINTKHHPNSSVWVAGETFLVNGARQPYVRNARFEARRTERLLSERAGFSVPTTGVIAVVGANKGLKVKEQPQGGTVHVVERGLLTRWLTERPTRLDASEIERLYAFARKSTTWT
jgi:Nuclease-related domain